MANTAESYEILSYVLSFLAYFAEVRYTTPNHGIPYYMAFHSLLINPAQYSFLSPPHLLDRLAFVEYPSRDGPGSGDDCERCGEG